MCVGTADVKFKLHLCITPDRNTLYLPVCHVTCLKVTPACYCLYLPSIFKMLKVATVKNEVFNRTGVHPF